MPYAYHTGKITRLYGRPEGLHIRLDSTGEQYWKLNANHQNYNYLSSIISAAAINRYQITFRMEDYSENAPLSDIILYVVIDW